MLRLPLMLSRFTTVRIVPVSSVRHVMNTPGERTDIKPNEKQRISMEEQQEIEERYQRRLDEMDAARMKARHIGVMGCFIAVLFGTQAYCLWNRRSKYRKMNKIMPPIKFDQFKEEYLLKGSVARLVHHPNFGVVDVFLGNLTEEESREKSINTFLSTFSAGPERFEPQPDLRFSFDGSVEDLERAILEAQTTMKEKSMIHIENNAFPNYRELALIGGGSIFCTLAVALAVN